jgi:hypothetical protein
MSDWSVGLLGRCQVQPNPPDNLVVHQHDTCHLPRAAPNLHSPWHRPPGQVWGEVGAVPGNARVLLHWPFQWWGDAK